MGNIRKKMTDQVTYGLPGFNVLLSANRTITLRSGRAAIKAYFFRSDLIVRQPAILFKNKDIRYN
jgi:hypothetical protein